VCGIAGVVIRGATVTRAMLEPMAERLAHRGPDGRGFFAWGPFGLCHTRLSIIDLETGQQPIATAGGKRILVANGEIYNYVELTAELEDQGCSFSTHSDSETILQAYTVDPDQFATRLRGMFAAAIFDGQEQRLVLVRDPLGIKPLFYARLPDRVIFASEMKAILPLMPKAPEVNPRGLSQYLHTHCTTGEETIFADIHRVLPGEIVEIDADLNLRRRQYWTPLRVQPRDITQDEAEEEFDALIGQVIREHSRSDVPYGLFLSGGNDSAVLLALLSRFQDQPVRTFTVGYQESLKRDEVARAEQIAEMFASRHTSLRLDRAGLFARVPHHVWAADDLMRDYACLPTSALSELAGKELKVVFCGEGGDEVFGGYSRYRLPRAAYLLTAMVFPGSGGFRTRSDWWRPRSRRAFGPALAALGASFRQPYKRAWRATPRAWTHLQRCQYTDMVTDLTDSLLVKVDRMMMGFSLEGRVPYLDQRVVEFGLGLPDRLKVHKGEPKQFFRRWAERYLPADHIYRKKRGFPSPVRSWLTGEVLDELERKLLRNRAVGEWFDVERLPPLFEAQRRDGKAAREVFCLMQFAIWHRLFIEDAGKTKPEPEEDVLDWIR
jgi:asparagine synthase (glutamine-hydrolysing)